MNIRELVKKYMIRLELIKGEIKIVHGGNSTLFKGYQPAGLYFYSGYTGNKAQAKEELDFLSESGPYLMENALLEELISKYNIEYIGGRWLIKSSYDIEYIGGTIKINAEPYMIFKCDLKVIEAMDGRIIEILKKRIPKE